MNQTQDYYYKKGNMILSHGIWGEGRSDSFLKTLIEALWAELNNLDGWCDLDDGCWQMFKEKIRWLDGQESVSETYRDVRSVTRDFIIGLTFYFVMSGQKPVLRDIHYPRLTRWYRMTSTLHNWRQYLITGKDKYLHRYERKAIRDIKRDMLTEPIRKKLYAIYKERQAQGKSWKWVESISEWFGIVGYVKHLEALKAYTVNSDQVKSCLLSCGVIPEWNYALRVMCGDILTSEDLVAIRNFLGGKGYLWTSNERPMRTLLPFTERYQNDKHFLHWLMVREYGKNWKEIET